MSPPNERSSPVAGSKMLEIGSPRIVVIHQPEAAVGFGELADTPTAHGFQSGIGWNHDFAEGAICGKAGDQTGLRVVDP